MQGYLYHWREEGDSAPLSREQSLCLFGNVDDIYRFNSGFLDELQSCGLDPVEVARCFVRNNSGFTIYTDYCTNYPRYLIVIVREKVVSVEAETPTNDAEITVLL